MISFLLFFTLTHTALANKEPHTQDDLYIWKAPYLPRTLTPFQNVERYHFTLRAVSKKLHERVQKAKENDFGDQCGDNAPRDWPIYQYDLGRDGQLLIVSCISRSMDSWSVYYHHTIDDELKAISVQFPVLNTEKTDRILSPPKIVGFENRRLLKNSEILQRRVVSRHQEPLGTYRAEWIWKEGYGLALIKYSFFSYDQDNQPQHSILFQEGVQ